MIEESPRWVRGRLGDETVVDSKRVNLLYEPERLPVWLFPENDVRLDAIPADAVRRHGDLVHVQFGALDEWLEEDEQQIGHPPDPHHRIDVLPVKDLVAFYNERVDIEVDGEPQERPRTQWSVH